MTDKMECARSQNIPWKRSKTEKGLKKCRKFFFVERRENFFSQFRIFFFFCRNFDVEKSLSFPDGICSLCVMAVQRFEFWFSYHLVARQRKKRAAVIGRRRLVAAAAAFVIVSVVVMPPGGAARGLKSSSAGPILVFFYVFGFSFFFLLLLCRGF
jgi:hypothetical protein